jgi:hypothetical protein
VDVEIVAAEILGEHLAELYVVVDEKDVFHALARVTPRVAVVRGFDVMNGHWARDKALQSVTQCGCTGGGDGVFWRCFRKALRE